MFKRFPFIHNHGDFVHLDALRDWLRGVVSLETFLKSKDDKAIVKDMHFTDERTTVDYIDTKDDTEKTETLCEYLTSDVFDETNPTQFNKVDKISFIKNENGERRINVREKNNKKQRLSVILSNIPIAYDATTDTYNGTSKSHHIGVNENGVKIYNDETLQTKKEYKFCSKKTLPDCNPFGSITNQTTSETLNFQKTDFLATVVGNVVIGGQIMYTLNNPIWLESKQSIRLMLTPATMGASKFADTVYPKVVMTPNNSNVNINIMKMPPFPMTNSTPTYVTITNTIESRSPIQQLHFTF